MATNFNNYFPWMWEEAKRQGMKKGVWMQKSGINSQRFTEFNSGSRDISTEYFVSLTKGLGLSIDNVESKSKIRFTKKQREQLESLRERCLEVLEIETVRTFTREAIERYPFLQILMIAANDGDEEFLKATIKHAYKKYIKGK